ncbi:AMP-binding protein [Actinomadura rudentiformis]|uniref:AMP-binding protein n=1 Tax=Actinomadura rudentiformis TaxID=359158 RepID=A0A6H9YMG6_9ACTN|nr:AMP-binding protein [Actinomadura rudentiformis]KAB2341572.1 AMP-binding protein [Actinomadura rudentiformis]
MSTFERATTVPGLLRGADLRFGAHRAVVDGETELSYRELAALAEQAARAFRACGTRPGDRVALWMPNRAEYIVAALGALSAGAALVPLNTRYRGQEAAAILARSRATTLVTSNGFLGTDYLGLLRAAAAPGAAGSGPLPGLPFLRTLVDVPGSGEPHSPGTLSWSRFLERSGEVPAEEARAVAAAVQEDDLCDVLFTSGTTGRPKGVMSAHRQTVDVARIWATGARLTSRDRYAIVNPFFHGFGYKAGIIAALGAGATVYPVATLDAEALLALVERERISVMPGAPALFLTLLEHPRRTAYDLSSLRFATAGAATVPESLFSRMRDELGFTEVAQAYGLTECIMVSRSRIGEDPHHIAETTGPPVPGIELRLVDTTSGAEAPVGADGEILVRGRNVMLGYFEDETATREAIDANGWLHTGDIGRLDDHGCLKITDRLKDMFTVGGFNVYPAEVENVLAAHPDVSEAAVVARPDPRLGSAAHAFVVPVPGASPDPAELIAHCRARLANFKVPHELTLVVSLPRNASGKIVKRELSAAEPAPGPPKID